MDFLRLRLHRASGATGLGAADWARGFLAGLLLAVGCGRTDSFGTACTKDADCGEGAVCTSEGVCSQVEGECQVDDDCEEGEKCLDFQCVGQQICDDNLECPPGQVCVKANPGDEFGVCDGPQACPPCPDGTICDGMGSCVPVGRDALAR